MFSPAKSAICHPNGYEKSFIGNLPHAIFNISVSRESNHFIFFGNVVQEGMFVIGKKSVGHPDLISKITRQRDLDVRVRSKGKSVILPILT